jgi:hypothetical protein
VRESVCVCERESEIEQERERVCVCEREREHADLVAIEGISKAVVATRVGGRSGRDGVLAQGGAIHELRHERHQTRQPTLLAFRVQGLGFRV